MPITWSLVDSPTGGGKVLMTNGGKRWGTHDLVTKKKYIDFEGHVEFLMMGKRGASRAAVFRAPTGRICSCTTRASTLWESVLATKM